MRRLLSIVLPAAAVVLVAGVAFAQMGGGMMGGGMMGGGMMGGGTMGGSAAQSGCPGMTSDGAPTAQITDEKARDLAQKYADKHLQGFTVDKVLPFTGMHMTMYSVELKGPKDEVRVLHINAWGNVMPFGGPSRRAG